MSSLNIVKTRYKIALFVAGLSYDGNFFSKQINKLIENDGSNLIKYDEMIDMSNYSVTQSNFIGASKGSFTSNTKAISKFSTTVAQIINLSKNNSNKTILIKTKLDKRPYKADGNTIIYKNYDSIENQSIKLKVIIENIKSIDSSIEIILIGHSQGGLVNLNTSIKIPNKISKIISISTPYSPVTTAYLLRGVNYVATMFNKNTYMMFDKKDYDEYENRVKELSDSTFYTNLKNKRNDLTNRPSLHVIVGISAHFMTSEYLYFLVPFEVNHRYPFDGLVMGREQVDIENCELYVLHNKGVECYEKSDNFTHSCCTQFGLINDHICKCDLPCFDFSSAIFKSALSLLEEQITNGKIDLNQIPIVKSICQAASEEECSDETYRQYYDIIAGNFSHKNIILQNETIGIILGVLKK